MSKIQNDWKQMTLGQVVTLQYGKGLPLRKRIVGNVPVFGSGGIIGYHNQPLIKDRGLIVGRKGSVGTIYKSSTDFFPIDTVFYIAEKDTSLDFDFLFYLLKSIKLDEMNSDSAVPGLNRDAAYSRKILVPKTDVQKSIAAVLSSLDEKIEILQEENNTLEEMAQRLFKEWFVDFNFPNENGKPYTQSGGKMVESELGEIPEGWIVENFSNVVDVLSGGTPKTTVQSYWNGSIPFFTPKDAKKTFFVASTEKSITEQGLEHCNSRLYPSETVFITARGTVGKCALALRAMAMNQSCYALVGKDVSNLFVFLLTKQLIDQIKKSASGAVFDAITVSTFASLHFPFGDKGVVDQFETLVRPIFNKILENTKEVKTLSEIRDQLLPKLMSGDLSVSTEDGD